MKVMTVNLARAVHGAAWLKTQPDGPFHGMVEAPKSVWGIIPWGNERIVCDHEHPNSVEAAECSEFFLGSLKRTFRVPDDSP